MHTYRAQVVRVLDGDTIDFDIDLGFSMWIHKERVRLYGIDAPEIKKYRGVTDEEKALGLALKATLELMLPVGAFVTLETHADKKGKFGRYLGVVVLEDGTHLNDWLVEEGLVEVNYYR